MAQAPATGSPLAWAAGIMIGVALALSAAWLVGVEPDKMKIESMMHAIEDAMEPKRKGVDATSGFGRADGRDVTRATEAKTLANGSDDATESTTIEDVNSEPATESDPATPPSTDVATNTATPTGPAPPKVNIDPQTGAATTTPVTPEPAVRTETNTEEGEATETPATNETAETSEEPDTPEGPIENLRAALAGKTIQGGRDFGGQKFTLRLGANGGLQAEVVVDESFGSTGIDNGRWTVEGDQACFRLSYLADGRRICSTVAQGVDGMTFTAPGGGDRGWRVR